MQARLPGCQAAKPLVDLSRYKAVMCCRDMTFSSEERVERGEIGGVLNREADLQSPFGFTVSFWRRLRPETVGVMWGGVFE